MLSVILDPLSGPSWWLSLGLSMFLCKLEIFVKFKNFYVAFNL